MFELLIAMPNLKRINKFEINPHILQQKWEYQEKRHKEEQAKKLAEEEAERKKQEEENQPNE